ncbi:hypothetical protein TI05_05075 [Achromatium sp. WMS3]|nr:hypothetical protein TI05_05075 [Achromatium sp. WMS3]
MSIIYVLMAQCPLVIAPYLAPVTTVVKMLEPLSEDLQNQVAKHLREYLADLQDELPCTAECRAGGTT